MNQLILSTVPATLLTAAINFSAQFICLVTIVERLLIEGGYYYIVTFLMDIILLLPMIK